MASWVRNLILLLCLFCSIKAQAQSPYIAAVDEYVPAPGQFVNTLPQCEEGDDAEAMVAKCTERLANNARQLVTLGAWGGYVTFHFDHPVVNVPDERDLLILGNANEGGSEAGIVMVSRDENGNGLPDDTWYELSGSADTDSTHVIYGYAICYQLASTEESGNDEASGEDDVPWTDNQGNEGVVPHNAFHTQPYFPLWLSAPLKFFGTRLPDNAHDTSGSGRNWVLTPFRYGYVDNLPNRDLEGNSFDLSWAVHPVTRTPVWLPSVDFIRVYTALNQTAGWLGETSTEISGAEDLHPEAVCRMEVLERQKTGNLPLFDLMGRRIPEGRTTSTFILKPKNILIK